MPSAVYEPRRWRACDADDAPEDARMERGEGDGKGGGGKSRGGERRSDSIAAELVQNCQTQAMALTSPCLAGLRVRVWTGSVAEADGWVVGGAADRGAEGCRKLAA